MALKAPEIRKSGSYTHRGKNDVVESYRSARICLMSGPARRYIEHVSRPLALRSGDRITSQTLTAHSVTTPRLLYLQHAEAVINETNENNGRRETGAP